MRKPYDRHAALLKRAWAFASVGVLLGLLLGYLYGNRGTEIINCSGSCGGGATISWECSDGNDCSLNCTSGSAVGSCAAR